jgi:hypothetical protein
VGIDAVDVEGEVEGAAAVGIDGGESHLDHLWRAREEGLVLAGSSWELAGALPRTPTYTCAIPWSLFPRPLLPLLTPTHLSDPVLIHIPHGPDMHIRRPQHPPFLSYPPPASLPTRLYYSSFQLAP